MYIPNFKWKLRFEFNRNLEKNRFIFKHCIPLCAYSGQYIVLLKKLNKEHENCIH